MKRFLLSREEFISRVKAQYIGEVKHQMTSILGHLTVLGAPIKLATTVGTVASSVGTGVKEIINYDFFESGNKVSRQTPPSPVLTPVCRKKNGNGNTKGDYSKYERNRIHILQTEQKR